MKIARVAMMFIASAALVLGMVAVVPIEVFADEASLSMGEGVGSWQEAQLGEIAGSTNADDSSGDVGTTDSGEGSQGEPAFPNTYDVDYVDERCEKSVAKGCVPIDANVSELRAETYVLLESVELDHELEVDGDVRIILTNGHTLKASEGIRVKKDATLTIYGQENATGELLVRKGITLRLTPEQQKEEDDRLARELAANPDYKEKERQLLYVWPCLEVVAGDHEPWPADSPDPDPDPDHAPKQVSKPTLDEALLSKDYVKVRPRSSHSLAMEGDAYLLQDDHFTCKECDAWFKDVECRQRVLKPEPAKEVDESAVGSTSESSASVGSMTVGSTTVGSDASIQPEASTITVSFDANGGTGTMDPIEVEPGESFTLPECTFTPPEGMEFSMWSLGKPGATAATSSPITIKAWWKKASDDTSSNTSSGTSTDTTTSGEDSGSSAEGQSNTEATTANTSQTETTSKQGETVKTGDSLRTLAVVDTLVFLGGIASLLLAKFVRLFE